MYEVEQELRFKQTGVRHAYMPFDHLSQEDKDRYVAMAKAAADNTPGPLFLEVGLSFTRQRSHPIMRHLYMDETRESIDAALKELREWLLINAGIEKPTPPIGCE